MAGRSKMQCFGCGGTIVCDDDARTLVHEGVECETFREIIERNARATPHVASPQQVDPDPEREDAEVRTMVAMGKHEDILEAARGFGLPTPDIETAARGCLREMRKRGWQVGLPVGGLKPPKF